MALIVKKLRGKAGNIRDMSSIPGSERFPGGRHGHSLQYSCLENSKDRGAWWATVQRVTKCQTLLKQVSSTHSGDLIYVYKMMMYIIINNIFDFFKMSIIIINLRRLNSPAKERNFKVVKKQTNIYYL